MHVDFNTTPVVLSLSSHDPSGSTGIQADIETAASLGCHAATIITALCAKDTRTTSAVTPTDTRLLIEQTRSILEDMPVRAIKLGFAGSVGNIEAIHSILTDYPQIPLIFDPIACICADGQRDAPSLRQAIQHLILPLTTIATTDIVEAHELAQQADTLDACAQAILDSGCQHLLISGARRSQEHFINHFFDRRGLLRAYTWPRLQLFSHGCGATLSASISSYLAHGLRLEDAVEQGQRFTWESLSGSRQLGMGRRTPNRFFWAAPAGNSAGDT